MPKTLLKSIFVVLVTMWVVHNVDPVGDVILG